MRRQPRLTLGGQLCLVPAVQTTLQVHRFIITTTCMCIMLPQPVSFQNKLAVWLRTSQSACSSSSGRRYRRLATHPRGELGLVPAVQTALQVHRFVITPTTCMCMMFPPPASCHSNISSDVVWLRTSQADAAKIDAWPLTLIEQLWQILRAVQTALQVHC
jgi:hypothetical protein